MIVWGLQFGNDGLGINYLNHNLWELIHKAIFD